MKKILFAAFYLLLFSTAFSQQYSRLSVTPIHLKHKSGSESLISAADQVSISDKYDYNYYGNNILSVPFAKVSPFQSDVDNLTQQLLASPIDQKVKLRKELNEAKEKLKFDDSMRMPLLIESLIKDKIANKILGSILIDPKLGYMTTDIIAKRSEYNASDADFVKAMNSETKMAAIRDKGLDLLKGVYIIIFDDLSQTESATDKNNPKNKIMAVTSNVYLFQIDIDSLTRTGQFDPLVFTEKDVAKATAFANYNFPLKFIMKTSAVGSAQNYEIDPASVSLKGLLKSQATDKGSGVKYILKTDEEANALLVSSLFGNAEFQLTKKYKPFQVKVNVFATRPITAKIGKKENLKIDELYKVTELVLSKSGKKSEKKVGWVRVKKVSDNKKNADGKTNPSEFYKVYSKKVSKGMKLTQKPQTGVTVGLGYNIGTDNVAAGPMLNLEYISGWKPGIRFGVSFGGFGKLSPEKVYVSNVQTEKYDFSGNNLYGDITGQKIFQANKLEFTPQIGAYISMLTIDKLNKKPISKIENLKGLTNSDFGALAGIKMGFNFGPHTQFNIGYKYGFSISSTLKCDEGEVTATDGSPITLEFKSPSVVTVGLRLFGF